LLLDVMPLVPRHRDAWVVRQQKLVLRNSTIPTSVTELFSTSVDNQTAVDLAIYQGERELAADCRKLAATSSCAAFRRCPRACRASP
jgi:molecular chaperone DnaK